MNDKKPKLSLNKELLISLQEKQMKSLIGGEMLYTEGHTSSCHSSDCNDSCCRKSCDKDAEYSVDVACEPPPPSPTMTDCA